MYPDFQMVTFNCAQMVTNCTYTMVARNKEELLRNIKNHLLRVHGVEDLPTDIAEKIDSAIKVG